MTDQNPDHNIPPKMGETPGSQQNQRPNFLSSLLRMNGSNSGTTQGGPNTLTTLTNAKGRIGIIGILVVVAVAYALNINPMNALSFFSADQNPQTYQQQTQMQR